MKTNILSAIILLTGATLPLTSCHDDLNINQPSNLTSLNMWTDDSDYEVAVNGMFTRFRSNYANDLHCVYGDLRADYMESGAVNSSYYNLVPKNEIKLNDSGSNWSAIYTIINDANLILRHIDDITFDREEVKNEVMGNTYFVRAYLYYLIARVWGDAPVLTSGFESEDQDDMYPSRNPVSEVYAQAESDMEHAISVMPEGKHLHKASRAAINMLRADYYSWKATRLGGGENALKTALEAVNSVLEAGYQLMPNFASIIGTENEDNNEFILTIPYTNGENVTPGGSPNFYAYFPAPAGDWSRISNAGFTQEECPTGSHAQYVTPQESFCEFMKSEPLDSRTDLTVREFKGNFISDDVQVKRMFVKFLGVWENNTRTFDTDMPIYRLAEAYLLKAEIENKLGHGEAALKALNEIAFRAYGVENYYTITDSEELAAAICNETLKELAAEGKIWWAYLRNNMEFKMIPSLVGKEDVLNILLWPVAQASVNTNPNITLTPGLDK